MKVTALVLIAAFAVSCSPVSKRALTRKFSALENKLQHHTGFMLYDPVQKKELYSFQSDKYFTPASNTKIFTFYTSLMVLGDSIPGIRYLERDDSLIFFGTGDPSLFYENVHDSGRVYRFLAKTDKQLFLADGNFHTRALGPGWAWDDLPFTYSSERSAFPVYGNYVTVQQQGPVLQTHPALFSYNITVTDSAEKVTLQREEGNTIIFTPAKNTAYSYSKIPFKTSAELTARLLSDTLKKEITHIHSNAFAAATTLYSLPADSLYKILMQESDNFIAEQLLLVCAGVLSDSLKPGIAIRYMKENHLADLPDEPVWVDGSGLSRYNLFTPRSIVKLWDKIYERVPRERLFSLLAIGGKTGTVKRWYKNEPPYIYGKTGTLSNNHCLSGFLVTRTGRTLIFSFMNNNHPAAAGAVRTEMEEILKELYQYY